MVGWENCELVIFENAKLYRHTPNVLVPMAHGPNVKYCTTLRVHAPEVLSTTLIMTSYLTIISYCVANFKIMVYPPIVRINEHSVGVGYLIVNLEFVVFPYVLSQV